MMTRLAATLLIVLQGTGFMGPAMLCSHAADSDMPACEHTVAPTSGAAIDARDACDDCGMPNCRSMVTCTASSTAVTSNPGSSSFASADRAAGATLIESSPSRHPAPSTPPPKA